MKQTEDKRDARRQRLIEGLQDFEHLARAISAIGKDLFDEISDLKHERDATRRPTDLIVTDHALVRYLERTKGLDTKALREEIAAICHPHIQPSLQEAYAAPVGNTTYVVRQGKVITVVATGEYMNRNK